FSRNRAWVLTSGGVRTDGQETYRFIHRSFMEYLAAQQLVRTSSRPEDLAQNLLAKVSESRWAEPGKLAIQMIDRNYHFGAATVFDWLLSHSEPLAKSERRQLFRLIADTYEVVDLPKAMRVRLASVIDSTESNLPGNLGSLRESGDVLSPNVDAPHWPIGSAVPPGIGDALLTVQELLQRSRSTPELALVAVTRVCATLEASIRGSLPSHDNRIGYPVNAAKKHKLITSEEAQLLTQAFQIRNTVAHGQRPNPIAHDTALQAARIVHDAISAVFERAGKRD